MPIMIQKISKCARPTSKFFVFTHITSKPLLTEGFENPTTGCVCSRPSILEFAPSRDTPRSYLICTTGGSSSPCGPGSAAHSRPRNSRQFFSVERLAPHFSDVKSTHVWEGDSTLEPHSITRVPMTATTASPREALQEGDEKLPPST